MPIPLVAEPEVLSRAALAAAAREAQAILSGAVKLARTLLGSGDARDRAALVEPFSGLEAEAMARLFDAPLPVMVARVDFLVPQAGGAPRALELNATIPAMPAYADLAAFSWLRAAARERGLSPRAERALVARCGSHMERLREALVAVHRARGGTRERPSIAVVARPADAQSGELRRLVEHFKTMGHEAAHLVPAECEPERWDVLYRHVWAHRVDPADPFARALLDPARFVLVNPVNGLLEAKALFARLSECAEDGALAARAGLEAGERAAAARLPWTRRLDPALAPRVVAEREGFVLKRSWDYGGKSVHLGAETAPAAWARIVEEATRDRLRRRVRRAGADLRGPQAGDPDRARGRDARGAVPRPLHLLRARAVAAGRLGRPGRSLPHREHPRRRRARAGAARRRRGGAPVISGESRGTRCVMGRLEAGEEVVAALRELARVERIDAGFVRAQGAVDGFELARYDAAARRYVPAGGATGPAELVSLAGSVSLEPDGVGVRLWAVLAVAETGRAQAQPDEAVRAPQGAPRGERGSAAGTDLERAGGRGGAASSRPPV